LLVAVAVDDQLQLFDPELGLALPGKETAAAGTLAELSADDALLRQLDVEGHAYPVTAEQLQESEALIVASPMQLAERSRLIESGLEGENFIKLAVEVQPLVDRMKKHSQVKSVALWQQPFIAILDEHTLPQTSAEPFRQRSAAEFAPLAERPLLWKARVLHFQGNKEVRSDERDDPLARPRQGHLEAVKLYHDPAVRPSDADLSQLEPDARTIRGAGKAAAGYWLGLLSFDRGNYDVALNWLGERTLDLGSQGFWASGARYNLARTYEALGNVEEAVRLLESEAEEAPQRHGNLLRARRLMAAQAESPPAAAETPTAG
jgi:tetratricopeptide (TPR) repeat protein